MIRDRKKYLWKNILIQITTLSLLFGLIHAASVEAKTLYSPSKVGTGSYNTKTVEQQDIIKISGNTVQYRTVYDPYYGDYSRTKKSKITSSTKYYAVDKTKSHVHASASKSKAKYMYKISKAKAKKIAKKKGVYSWIKIKNNKIKVIVVHAEYTAG